MANTTNSISSPHVELSPNDNDDGVAYGESDMTSVLKRGIMKEFHPAAVATDAMVSNWYEFHCMAPPAPVLGGQIPQSSPVVSMYMDPQDELVWAATGNGFIHSFDIPTFERHTSFGAHSGDLQKLLVNSIGTVSLSSTALKVHSRGGLHQVTFSPDRMRGMHSCSFFGNNCYSVIAGGESDKAFVFDLLSLRVADEINIQGGISTICASESQTWLGGIDGSVCLRDSRSLQLEHRLDLVHSGGVASIAFSSGNNWLVTCGYTKRLGQIFHDSFIQVYDTRTMEPLPPILSTNTTDVQLFPDTGEYHSSKILLMSQIGDFRVYDLTQPPDAVENIAVHSVENDSGPVELQCCCISPSSSLVCFGDSSGLVHTWTDHKDESLDVSVHGHGGRPSSPLPLRQPPSVSIDHTEWDERPLSDVYFSGRTNEPLLSDWPAKLPVRVPQPSLDIGPEVLDSLMWQDFVGYAPNPENRRPNQAPTPAAERHRRSNLKVDSPSGMTPKGQAGGLRKRQAYPPRSHRRVELNESRLTYGGFDFGFYNRTKLPGLDNFSPNTYVNALLQVVYYSPQIKAAMLNHLCEREHCLSCELGFLFRMMDDSKGWNCEARNFLKIFRQMREAQALGLWEPEDPFSAQSVFYPRMIETFSRFLLSKLHKELTENAPVSAYALATGMVPIDGSNPYAGGNGESTVASSGKVVEELFGTESETVTRCEKCGEETRRVSKLLHVDLKCQNSPNLLAKETDPPVFTQLLRRSLDWSQRTSAWCEKCKKTSSSTIHRVVKNLPGVLSVNNGFNEKNDVELWKQVMEGIQSSSSSGSNALPGAAARALFGRGTVQPSVAPPVWYPPEIRFDKVKNSDKSVHWEARLESPTKSDKEKADRKPSKSEDEACFKLSAVVSQVHDPRSKDGWKSRHLVAYVKVDKSYHKEDDDAAKGTDWFLFNDFCITPSSLVEASTFYSKWEIPCVAFYTNERSLDFFPVPSVRNPITHASLWAPPLCSSVPASFVPLSPGDIPGHGAIVALDAEFVALTAPETDEKEFGTEVVKGARLGIGRVSIVRGHADSTAGEGVAFIDDYIHSSEPVVDYLTRFSGLVQGDLDYRVSPHHVVTHKQLVAKLRYLIDNGVVLVGHGLKQDFRVINITVAPEQVIDTVEIFHLPNQRKISLRWLAWHLLGTEIQADTHDSIEDARTALAVYKHYRNLVDEGKFEETLRKIYDVGRSTNWQIAGV